MKGGWPEVKVSIVTLGCKVNQAEMSEMESTLRGQGHEIVGLDSEPDVCVVNTCTVTAKSDYQSRQMIRRAGRSGARVIVTGCYSELKGNEVGRMEGVEKVVGNLDKSNIISLIDANTSNGTGSLQGGRTRFFLKVQDGCNNACTYCIVHVARGRSRSITPDKVIENINRAVDAGYKEVVLTGIHLGQYGSDLAGGASVKALVSEVLNKTTINRLRLSSFEVTEIEEGLLGLFENPRLMPHLHVPLQSGDDDVLKMMNRGYDTTLFSLIITDIHKRLPHAAIGTDIIAGFPGESQEAFENTVKLVEELPFTYLHVFPYSFRPGTPAAEMEDIVGDTERKGRAARLRELSKAKKSSFLDAQVGSVREALFEERVENGMYRGTTDNYLRILAPSEHDIRGSVAPACIAGVEGETLCGEPVKGKQPLDLKRNNVCTNPVQ